MLQVRNGHGTGEIVGSMRRTAAIALTLLYLVSASGIVLSKFYCCGKLKEISFFMCPHVGNDCPKAEKTPGCCDTRNTYIKVKDVHTGIPQLKIALSDPGKTFSSFCSSVPVLQSPNTPAVAYATIHAPPWPGKRPVYLTVCNFRI